MSEQEVEVENDTKGETLKSNDEDENATSDVDFKSIDDHGNSTELSEKIDDNEYGSKEVTDAPH